MKLLPGETSQSSSLSVGVRGVGGMYSNGDSCDSLSESDATLSDCSQRTTMQSSSSSSRDLKLNRLPSIICSSIALSERNPGAATSQDHDVDSQEFANESFMILSPHRLSPLSLSSHDSMDDISAYYRSNNSTIEVPVLDAINAQKFTANSVGNSSNNESLTNALSNPPPMILLEIPSGVNSTASNGGFSKKCLSPIHEMPTPTPSPLLTPIMPRPRLMANSSSSCNTSSSSHLSPLPSNNQNTNTDKHNVSKLDHLSKMKGFVCG